MVRSDALADLISQPEADELDALPNITPARHHAGVHDPGAEREASRPCDTRAC